MLTRFGHMADTLRFDGEVGAVDYPNDVMIFAYENMRLLYGH